MPLSAEQRRARARVAINARHHPDKPELVAADVAELERARIDQHIQRLVDAAPPLTPAQRERLALLLHPGTPGGGNG